jgi:peptidyl-tRNA hydrolase
VSEQHHDPQTGDAPSGDPATGKAPDEHDPFAPGGAPWAMQLAVRDDRQARPGHLAVCAAAGTAVVRLLADPRAVDGPWTPYVRRWVDGRIRKVVRRGRGAQFAATGALDHVEVARGDVVVRAFVPGPTDAVPRELAKLQVGGTDMPRDGDAWPVGEEPLLMTVALNPAVPMTTGKAAAQTGHAAQLAWMALEPRELAAIRQAWLAQECAVRVVIPGEAHWRRLLRAAPVAVHDGGFTEVAPGTLTAIACWQA